jgi:hypothetical protein
LEQNVNCNNELAGQVEEARAEAAEAQSLVKELTAVAQEARAQAAAAAREAGPALAQAEQSEAQVRLRSLPLLLQLIGCAAVFALLLCLPLQEQPCPQEH